jgi:hypothetical protein
MKHHFMIVLWPSRERRLFRSERCSLGTALAALQGGAPVSLFLKLPGKLENRKLLDSKYCSPCWDS